MNIVIFDAGDCLTMKKEHPCGGREFTVLRTGSDIQLKCNNCGHIMTVPRIKLEKNIRNVKSKKENEIDS